MKGLTSSVDVSFGQESLDRGRLRAVKSGGIFFFGISNIAIGTPQILLSLQIFSKMFYIVFFETQVDITRLFFYKHVCSNHRKILI